MASPTYLSLYEDPGKELELEIIKKRSGLSDDELKIDEKKGFTGSLADPINRYIEILHLIRNSIDNGQQLSHRPGISEAVSFAMQINGGFNSHVALRTTLTDKYYKKDERDWVIQQIRIAFDPNFVWP